MTQEQRERAARVLEILSPNDLEYSDLRGNFFPDGIDEAIQLAINALREQGWVRTSDRLPTKQDSPTGMVVNAWSYSPMCGEYGFMAAPYEDVETTPNPKDYWMPLPPLPEADE